MFINILLPRHARNASRSIYNGLIWGRDTLNQVLRQARRVRQAALRGHVGDAQHGARRAGHAGCTGHATMHGARHVHARHASRATCPARSSQIGHARHARHAAHARHSSRATCPARSGQIQARWARRARGARQAHREHVGHWARWARHAKKKRSTHI